MPDKLPLHPEIANLIRDKSSFFYGREATGDSPEAEPSRKQVEDSPELTLKEQSNWSDTYGKMVGSLATWRRKIMLDPEDGTST